MGSTASAELFWGFKLPDDLKPELPWALDRQLWSDNHIAFRHGVPLVPFADEDKDPKGHEAWYANYLEQKACLAAVPARFMYSGNGYGDDMPCHVGLKASHWECSWYETKMRDVLPVWEPQWELWLRHFCEKMEIPWQTPTWCLIASYG